MENPPDPSLVQHRAAQRRYVLLTAPHQPLYEAMGLPPETPLVDAGLCSATTIRAGRRWVQVRCGPPRDEPLRSMPPPGAAA